MNVDSETLKAGIAFLAVVLAFYGLTAKEQRSPYTVRTVYSIIYIVLFAFLFSLAATLLVPNKTKTAATTSSTTGTSSSVAAVSGNETITLKTTDTSVASTPVIPVSRLERGLQTISRIFSFISLLLLFCGIILMLCQIWAIHNRHLHFRSDQKIQNLYGVKQIVTFFKK